MRAGRLLAMVLLLQSRGRMTAEQLAEELEVSVRTVYRDVEALSGAGVPVYGDAGHGGGFRLLEGYRTQLTGLQPEEAESLFLAGVPGAAADLGLDRVLAVAQLKLEAALPAALRDRAGRVRERFHLDAPGWYREQEAPAHLAVVAEAVWSQRRLRMRYRRWAEPQEVEREVEPYGLVLKSGVWYLVAGVAGTVRTYRVSQVLETRFGGCFDRPLGFDLAGHWETYLADYDARRLRLHAVVRLRQELVARLPDRADAAVVRAVGATAEGPDAAGWVTAAVPVESVALAVPLVLAWGADAEVLGPPELREAVVRAVRELSDRYA